MEKLSFGGVAFEILHPRSAGSLELDEECARFVARGDEASSITAAHAACALSFDPGLTFAWGTGVANHVRWHESDGDGSLLLEAPRVRAQLRRLGPAKYAVTGRIEPSPEGAFAFLRGISAALVHLSGGAVFHAVTVERAGRAVLLLGPSGAGKSTAMSLLREARCIAYDHAAVVPGRNGWLVWGLPGGSPTTEAQRTPVLGLPLVGALRIRRGMRTPEITTLDGADAVFALRESLECGEFSLGAEEASLDRMLALAAAVPVGAARTVLGEPWDGALARWLDAEAR